MGKKRSTFVGRERGLLPAEEFDDRLHRAPV
jgi:hypothetical protein